MVTFRVDSARRRLYSGDMSTAGGKAPEPRGPANVLSEKEIHALLATFSRRAPTGIRNRALIMLLWRTGLRIAEAIALEARDLQLDASEPRLTVRNGKFGKQRVVGIHQDAVAEVELWLGARRRLGLAHARPVFCTISRGHRGGQLKGTYVRAMLSSHARRAQLDTRVHPHAFRATLAVELAREGVPLPAIRDVLGHSNVAHTDAYLRRVFPQDAIEAVLGRKRAPIDPVAQRAELVDALADLDDAGVRKILRALKPAAQP